MLRLRRRPLLYSTLACEKFSTYILGKKFTIETDHKPLVHLLGVKHLDSLPPRILQFRLRLTRDSTTTSNMYQENTCTQRIHSRNRHSRIQETKHSKSSRKQPSTHANLPASEERLKVLQDAQNSDPVCSLVTKYCRSGWPTKHNASDLVRPYWEVREHLTLHKNLLLYNSRIVVPIATSLQQETLSKLHQGHQGIDRCRQRAKISVWWPGLSAQIND